MLTTIYGHETAADLHVIGCLERRFGKPIVFFLPLMQPCSEHDGYWHVRTANVEGVMFVRQNGLGELLIHGPSRGELLQQELDAYDPQD